MPGQQGPCPHCGIALPEPGKQFMRNPGSSPCRCLVLGVQPAEPAHHACPVHGDLEQLAAAERSVIQVVTDRAIQELGAP